MERMTHDLRARVSCGVFVRSHGLDIPFFPARHTRRARRVSKQKNVPESYDPGTITAYRDICDAVGVSGEPRADTIAARPFRE
jgi:hypothetical protein